MKLFRNLSLLAVTSFVTMGSPSFADDTMEALCIEAYGDEYVVRCLNAIQAHFDLSATCNGVTVTGAKTAPDLQSEGGEDCTYAETCLKISEGGVGSGCGSG